MMEYDKPVMLALRDLYDFPNHPYRVVDDEQMELLAESIRQSGVITPGLARPHPDGNGYQIISGHRRKRACEILGAYSMPFIVREMSDDEATIKMAASNFQREKVMHSEKAWAYRYMLEAMKRQQGERSDLTSATMLQKLDGKSSREQLSEVSGDSHEQIRRYIRLTYLTESLLSRVDRRDDYGDSLAFNVGVTLSYLTEEEQNMLDYIISSSGMYPSIRQAKELRELSEHDELDEDAMLNVLQDYERNREPRVIIPHKEIQKYFPNGTTLAEARKITFDLLENYRRRWIRQTNKTDSDVNPGKSNNKDNERDTWNKTDDKDNGDKENGTNDNEDNRV
jgi:ParB family chromosome partitioning protein